MLFIFRLVLIVAAGLIICQADIFEDVNLSAANECWSKLSSSDAEIRSCYYEPDSALSQDEVNKIIKPRTASIPGELFDPIVYSRYIGITAYSMGSYEVQNDDRDIVNTRGLDINYIRSTILRSDGTLNTASPDTVKFTAFCGVRRFFRPIQQCFIDTAPSRANAVGCSRVSSDALQDVLELSLMFWDIYIQICSEVHHCSDDPISECRHELYGADISKEIDTIEAVCHIIPRYESSFRRCVTQKTHHCLPVTTMAVNYLLQTIGNSYKIYVEKMDDITAGCNKITTERCLTDYTYTRDLIDQGYKQCMEPVYDLYIGEEDNKMLLIELATNSLCAKVYTTQSCLEEYLNVNMSGVPDVCTTTYQKLMHDTMARLFNACDMSVSGDDVAPAQSGGPSAAPDYTLPSADFTYPNPLLFLLTNKLPSTAETTTPVDDRFRFISDIIPRVDDPATPVLLTMKPSAKTRKHTFQRRTDVMIETTPEVVREIELFMAQDADYNGSAYFAACTYGVLSLVIAVTTLNLHIM